MVKYLWILLLCLASCMRIPHSSVAILELRQEGVSLGSASAFAVSPFELVTAGHVCGAADEVGVPLSSPTLGNLEVLAVDPVADLCLLGSKVPLAPIQLADYRYVQADDRAYILGFPLGIGQILTSGTVAAPYYIAEGQPYLLLSLPAAPGNSGSPVLDSQGRVIGVLVAGMTLYPQVTFAAPGSALRAFLERSRG